MKLRFLLLAALATALVAAPAQSAPAEQSTAGVIDFATFAPVEGAWSKLVRNGSGISMTLHTSGLTAGDAYTVWFVAFNHPENCTAPIGDLTMCGEPDLVDPAVATAAFLAGGHVIGTDGPATISGSLKVGQTKDALSFPDGAGGFITPFTTLTNPMGAEVHLIVRRHGPWVPGSPELFQTFWACNPECVDTHASIHLPSG
jgi:hypothetical protein